MSMSFRCSLGDETHDDELQSLHSECFTSEPSKKHEEEQRREEQQLDQGQLWMRDCAARKSLSVVTAIARTKMGPAFLSPLFESPKTDRCGESTATAGKTHQSLNVQPIAPALPTCGQQAPIRTETGGMAKTCLVSISASILLVCVVFSTVSGVGNSSNSVIADDWPTQLFKREGMQHRRNGGREGILETPLHLRDLQTTWQVDDGWDDDTSPQEIASSGQEEQKRQQPKSLFPLSQSDFLGFFLAAVGLILAAGGGVGGGGILVPLYILILRFTPRRAIPLSNVTVFGGAVANTILNAWKRHPLADRPVIDWDLMLIMEPLTISGALLGSFLNKILPEMALVLLLVLLLSFTAYKTLSKAWKMYNKETTAALGELLMTSTTTDLRGGGGDIPGGGHPNWLRRLSSSTMESDEEGTPRPITVVPSRTESGSETSTECIHTKNKIEDSSIRRLHGDGGEKEKKESPRMVWEIGKTLPPSPSRISSPSLFPSPSPSPSRIPSPSLLPSPSPSRLPLLTSKKLRFGECSSCYDSPKRTALDSNEKTTPNLHPGTGGSEFVIDCEKENQGREHWRSRECLQASALEMVEVEITSNKNNGETDRDNLSAVSFPENTEVGLETCSEDEGCGREEKSSIEHRGGGVASDRLQRILDQERETPKKNVGILFTMFLVVLTVNILKGGGAFSPFGIECGSLAFWLAQFFIHLWVFSVFIMARSYLVQRTALKQRAGYAYVEGDIIWDERSTIFYPLICCLAGFCAGMFGIGGGIVKGPLMLAMGVHPAVSAATSACMILFTSFTATTSYAVFGLLVTDYAVMCLFVGFFATIFGQTVMMWLLKKHNRNSYIAFSIGIVVFLSAIMLTVESVVRIRNVEDIADEMGYSSGRLCSAMG